MKIEKISENDLGVIRFKIGSSKSDALFWTRETSLNYRGTFIYYGPNKQIIKREIIKQFPRIRKILMSAEL